MSTTPCLAAPILGDIEAATMRAEEVWAERFEARRWSWQHPVMVTSTSGGMRRHATADCGRLPRVSHGGKAQQMVDIVRTPAGRVMAQGMRQCNSVWACPSCSARIAATRAAEIAQGVRVAIDEKGWAVAFVTLTLQHQRGDSLAELWDILSEGLKRGTGNNRAWRAFGDAHGVDVGDGKRRVRIIRLDEATVGAATGWHPHLHLLMFTERAESHEATQDMHARMMNVLLGPYQRYLKRQGHPCIDPRPGDARSGGWTVDTVTSGDDEAIGAYFAKVIYEGLGMEMSGAAKGGRTEARLTPMQLLARLASGEMGQGYWQRRAWWTEWVHVSTGRRQIVWSRGLKAALGVAEVEDDAIDDTWDVPAMTDNAHYVRTSLGGSEWAGVSPLPSRGELSVDSGL